METIVLMDTTIHVCSQEEAVTLWKEKPLERSMIWLIQETWNHCLDDPDQLQKIINKKVKKPGVY